MSHHGALDDIEGKRVLVVEDRFLLADDLGRMLRSLGAEVVGPVSSLEEAMEIVRRETVDAALLDIDLRGSTAFAVADLLTERNVPFAFATGYDRSSLPQQYKRLPFLAKPLSAHRLKRTLGNLLGGTQKTV